MLPPPAAADRAGDVEAEPGIRRVDRGLQAAAPHRDRLPGTGPELGGQPFLGRGLAQAADVDAVDRGAGGHLVAGREAQRAVDARGQHHQPHQQPGHDVAALPDQPPAPAATHGKMVAGKHPHGESRRARAVRSEAGEEVRLQPLLADRARACPWRSGRTRCPRPRCPRCWTARRTARRRRSGCACARSASIFCVDVVVGRRRAAVRSSSSVDERRQRAVGVHALERRGVAGLAQAAQALAHPALRHRAPVDLGDVPRLAEVAAVRRHGGQLRRRTSRPGGPGCGRGGRSRRTGRR